MDTHMRDPHPTTARLGLGCAGLFALPSRRDRRALIHEAIDAGVRHFDVAPMYGLGIAEQELGRALRGRQDQVTVATKFGIDARGWLRRAAPAQGPLRAAAARFQGLNSAAREAAVGPGVGLAGSVLYRSPGFDAEAAQRGLRRSLRRLGLEHLDLLLLHDPAPDVELTGVFQFLQDAVAEGVLRSWGVAGEPDPTLQVADRLPGDVPTLQVRWDSFTRTDTRPRTSALVTFGALGSALPRLQQLLDERPELRAQWTDALGVDCSRREVLAGLLLDDALAANPGGITLFSTTKSAHLQSAAARVRQPTAAASVEKFRELLMPFVGAPA